LSGGVFWSFYYWPDFRRWLSNHTHRNVIRTSGSLVTTALALPKVGDVMENRIAWMDQTKRNVGNLKLPPLGYIVACRQIYRTHPGPLPMRLVESTFHLSQIAQKRNFCAKNSFFAYPYIGSVMDRYTPNVLTNAHLCMAWELKICVKSAKYRIFL
jgi:hypothetical protein